MKRATGAADLFNLDGKPGTGKNRLLRFKDQNGADPHRAARYHPVALDIEYRIIRISW